MKNSFKKTIPDIICIFLITFVALLAVFYLFDLWGYDFSVPLYYSDGDSIFTCMVIKTLGQFGQCLTNPLVGAPFGSLLFDFPLYGDSIHNIVFITLYALLNDFGLVINTFYILLFPVTAIISYIVMRNLNVSRLFCVLGSLAFSFLSYRFRRGEHHLSLSAFTFIPLSILILFWLFKDDRFLKIGKGFFRYKRNYIALVLLVIIALSGIYYAFFTCFFIAVVIVILFLKDKKNRCFTIIMKGVVSIGIIAVSILAAAIPTFLKIYQYGANSQSPERSARDAEVYGMKIAQLIIPNRGYGISILKNLVSQYSLAPMNNEGTEYLGVIGIIGFLILLVYLFGKNNQDNELSENMKFLAHLNISAVLLGTIGGLGSLFAYLISSQIRAYNRISVFIAYFSILALCMGLSSLLAGWRPSRRRIAAVCLVPIFLVSTIEQFFPKSISNEAAMASFYSDRNFVEEIETLIGPNSMIFQLPYVKFPESAPVNLMGDYALFRGYLHSDTLKWSYGDFKGRASDLWAEGIAIETTPEMIKSITFAGFSGIYIDTYAYSADDLAQLRKEIEEVLGNDPLISEDGRLIFYSLSEYSQLQKDLLTDQQLKKEYEEATAVPVSWANGFSTLEQDEKSSWHWCSKEGSLVYYNTTDEARTYQITFTAISGYPENSNLLLSGCGINNTYIFNNEGAKISEMITLQPGKNELVFSTDAKQVEAPSDPRILYMRISNFASNG